MRALRAVNRRVSRWENCEMTMNFTCRFLMQCCKSTQRRARMPRAKSAGRELSVSKVAVVGGIA